MEPVQLVRRQSQGHKRKGVGSQFGYDGAYTGELYAFVNAAVAVDTAVVAASTGSKIRVLSYGVSCVAAGAGTVVFNTKPAGAGTAISQTIALPANGNVAESDNNGLFETAVSNGLSVTVTGNIVGVRVTYILVD